MLYKNTHSQTSYSEEEISISVYCKSDVTLPFGVMRQTYKKKDVKQFFCYFISNYRGYRFNHLLLPFLYSLANLVIWFFFHKTLLSRITEHHIIKLTFLRRLYDEILHVYTGVWFNRLQTCTMFSVGCYLCFNCVLTRILYLNKLYTINWQKPQINCIDLLN